jgi:hypothetical protein
MELGLARKILASNALDDEGSFYGPPDGLSLGTGLIVADVPIPYFNRGTDRFTVAAATVYILSHECDLDPENDKVLGGYCLVCPLLPIEQMVASAVAASLSQNEISAFLGNIAARRVSRFVYLPPLQGAAMGAVLNLNQITSTALSTIDVNNAVSAVSRYGLETIDMGLENHLRRAKSESLPLTMAPLRKGRTLKG